MKKSNKLGMLLMLVAALSQRFMIVLLLLNMDKVGNVMFIMIPLLILIIALEFQSIDKMYKEMK